MKKTILINARHPEEKRVAIVQDRRLTDFYVEVSSAMHLRGNVYKGVITALEPGLQAAFVDFGQGKQGFLPLHEVMPENFRVKTKEKNPKIKDVLAKGQELVVQVEHDPRGTKGASLTTYISLPGRYIVMMPGQERVGISRKIEDPEARERLKEAFKQLKVSKKTGFILRTAGEGCSTDELANDLKYLTKLWNKIKREAKKAQPPSLIYKEEDIAVRTVRDYLTSDVEEVLVDDKEAYQSVKAFLKLTMPWRSINVTHYRDKQPLFDRYDLEDQIGRLSDRMVILPSKGALVIDKTEALTAIDVNSARSRKEKNIEALALRTNLEAADEVARQLRLRDIGGLIVIDFIDMEIGKNRYKVEDRVRTALRQDKAHYDISRISKFGLMEMTRERMRTAYFESTSRTCPTCGGLGVMKSPELVAISALRDIHSRLSESGSKEITCRLPLESANYLMNTLRDSLTGMEQEFSARITVLADQTLLPADVLIEGENAEKQPRKASAEEQAPEAEKKSQRSRRKRKRPSKNQHSGEPGSAEAEAPEGGERKETVSVSEEPEPSEGRGSGEEAAGAKKKKTRRGRRKTTKKTKPAQDSASGQDAREAEEQEEAAGKKPEKTRRSRRRTARKVKDKDNTDHAEKNTPVVSDDAVQEGTAASESSSTSGTRKKRSTRRPRARSKKTESTPRQTQTETASEE